MPLLLNKTKQTNRLLAIAAYWRLYFEKVLVMIRKSRTKKEQNPTITLTDTTMEVLQKYNRQLLSHLLITRYDVLYYCNSVKKFFLTP